MFAQINSKTVVQCYRADEFFRYETYPKHKRTKKIQKEVLRKNARVSPPVYDIASEYTDPVEPYENVATKHHRHNRTNKHKNIVFNLCECNEDETDIYEKPKTWDSITNYYGNVDTTEVWADSEYKNRKLPLKQHKRNRNSNVNGMLGDLSSDNKKYKRRHKHHKKRGQHFMSDTAPSFEEHCPDELCAQEARINKNYSCNCETKEEPQLITKELTPSFLSLNSVAKVKDKFIGIFRKGSQKVINLKAIKNSVLNREETERNIENVITKREHACEQTGEPFFEIQVNPSDMCVVNPIEIRQQILKYGKPEKFDPKCICPSRGTLKPGEVCKSGMCKKAYKNKQINFNCWCEKKLSQCGDTTCDLVNTADVRTKQQKKPLRRRRDNRPLLEVQLDMDKMCVVNPKEIQHKILDNMTVDDICTSGVCREAALTNKTSFFCKCIRKKIMSDITECSQDTCVDTTSKKKSKLSLLCTRLCSKSENWPIRYRNNNDRKRIQRRSVYEINPNKLRMGKIFSQSGNLPQDKPEVKQENNKLSTRNVRIQSPRPGDVKSKGSNLKNTGVSNKKKYSTKDVTCGCADKCECDSDKHDAALKAKKAKHKEKLRKKKLAERRRNKMKGDVDFEKDMKQRAKLDKKGEKMARKQRLQEIKMMQKKMDEEPIDTNFCTACMLGLLKLSVGTLLFILRIIIYIIKHPKKAYWFVRDRISDPEGTYLKIKKWISDAILLKKLQIAETVRGSDTLTILADYFLDTSFYQSLANKGSTKKDQATFEQKSKARKRRIIKREQQAIHSCRHTLLTTLRQTPCLWVYHICPNFYPQCLGLLQFLRSFSHILMFIAAFACWTPCILTFELCRACLCCFMCTG